MKTAARYLVGDADQVLATLPASSVDLVMTSPPFLGLRSYLPADHPDKTLEMGSEFTPAEFIDRLLDVTEALARVLAPHGSIVIELGDTSAGSGGAGGDYTAGGRRDGQPGFAGSARAQRRTTVARGRTRHEVPRNDLHGGTGWPAAKSLCLIPELYRVALAYGRNPLNGRTTDPWIIRNVVSWVRRNPPPGRLGDKYRRGTSTLVVATKSPTRWFDDHEVRAAPSPNSHARTAKGVDRRASTGRSVAEGRGGGWSSLDTIHKTHSAPPLDWWEIASRSYRSTADHKHYASYPERLCEIPILSMCPPRVCTWCGVPPARILRPTAEYAKHLGSDLYDAGNSARAQDLRGANGRRREDGKGNAHISSAYEHDGWAECDCLGGDDRWRPGLVLDPFAGTGTTMAVAHRFGRDSIGIDLDARNADIARERIPDLAVEVAS